MSKWIGSRPDYIWGTPPNTFTAPTNALVEVSPFVEEPRTKWRPSYDDIIFDRPRIQYTYPDRGAFYPLPYPPGPGGVSTARPQFGLPGRVLPSAPRLLSPDIPSVSRLREQPLFDTVRRQDLFPSVAFVKSLPFTQPVPQVSDWMPELGRSVWDIGRTSHLAPHLAFIKIAPFNETIFMNWLGSAPDQVYGLPRATDFSGLSFDSLPLPNQPIIPVLPADPGQNFVIRHWVYAKSSGAFLYPVVTLTTTDAFPDVAMPGETLPDSPVMTANIAAIMGALNVAPNQPTRPGPSVFNYPSLFWIFNASAAATEQTLVSKWFQPASEPVRDFVRQQAVYPAGSPIDLKQLLAHETVFMNWYRATEQPLFDRARLQNLYPTIWFWPLPIPKTGGLSQYLLLLGVGS